MTKISVFFLNRRTKKLVLINGVSKINKWLKIAFKFIQKLIPIYFNKGPGKLNVMDGFDTKLGGNPRIG